MRRHEAIKYNKDSRAFHLLRKEFMHAAAIQLGREALERLITLTAYGIGAAADLLPSETKEVTE